MVKRRMKANAPPSKSVLPGLILMLKKWLSALDIVTYCVKLDKINTSVLCLLKTL